MNKPILKTCPCGNKRLDLSNNNTFFCEVCIYREKNKHRIAEIDIIMKKMKEPVVYVWKKDIKPGRVRTQTVNKTYNSYIASSAWQAKRVKLLKERGAACEACRKTTGLHVHHVDYSRLYYEEMSDLLVLCERCHDSLHAQYDKHKEDRRFKNMRWKSLYEFSMTFLRKALNKK